MKTTNRVITVVITILATALISGIVVEAVFAWNAGGFSGELVGVVFVFSLPFLILAGTPIALLINHYFRQKGAGGFLVKLLLHIAAGFVLVAAFLFVISQGEMVWSDDGLIFYLAGVANSVVYLVVLSVLKLTKDTGL